MPVSAARLAEAIRNRSWKNELFKAAHVRTLECIQGDTLKVVEVRPQFGRWVQYAGEEMLFMRTWSVPEEGLEVPAGYIVPPISFPRDVRAHVYSDNMFVDFDIVNCHFSLARLEARRLGITVPFIDNYCRGAKQTRQRLALQLGISTETAKKLCIRVLYGSGWRSFVADSKSEYPQLQNEPPECVVALMRDTGALLYAFKTKDNTRFRAIKDQKPGSSDISVLAVHLQDIERQIVDACMQHRDPDGSRLFHGVSYYYDGYVAAYTGGSAGDVTSAIPSFLQKLSGIAAGLGYPVKFDTKLMEPMNLSMIEPSPDTPNQQASSADADAGADARRDDSEEARSTEHLLFPVWALDKDYSDIKDRFERHYFKSMESGFCHIRSDGSIKPVKVTDLKEKFANVKVSGEAFISRWVQDPYIRTHTKTDFLPPPMKPAPGVYNSWSGFPISKQVSPPGAGVVRRDIELFMEHLEILAPGHSDYLAAFVAHMVQRPGEKPCRAHLFMSSPGCGKGLFGVFLSRLLGPKHFTEIVGFDKVTGTFNGATIQGKICIAVDEVCKKGHMDVEDTIKHLVSERTIRVERKYCDSEEISDFSRYILFSNSDNPIHISEDDRRFAVFACDESKRGDAPFWQRIAEAYDTPSVVYNIYRFLLDVSLDGWDFQTAAGIPDTEARKEVMSMCMSPTIKFMAAYCWEFRAYATAGVLEVRPKDLLNRINDSEWMGEHNMNPMCRKVTVQLLTKRVARVPGVSKVSTRPPRAKTVFRVDLKDLFAYMTDMGDYTMGEYEETVDN